MIVDVHFTVYSYLSEMGDIAFRSSARVYGWRVVTRARIVTRIVKTEGEENGRDRTQDTVVCEIRS